MRDVASPGVGIVPVARNGGLMDASRLIRTDTILLTAGLLLLGYLLSDVLLLVFAAILIAIGLDGLTRAAMRRVSLSRGWALAGVATGIAALVILAFSLSAAHLVRQFRELGETVGEFAVGIQNWFDEQGGMDLLDDVELDEDNLTDTAREFAEQGMNWGMSVGMNFGMSAVGALGSLVILVVLTMFLAANPALYRGGLLRLVPPQRRAMVDDTLAAIARALRWWFLGQLVSMLLLGFSVGLGLLLLGIEVWFALGVLTALLTFLPFIGPLIATIPIVAVGFTEGVQTGLIVLVGYIVIQNVEGNVIVPMIHQKAVELAPALLISVQLLLGLVFGVVGLILAAPLTVVAMVAVQKLWVEHTLGEKVTPS